MIVSVFSYTTIINADLQLPITIAIPATKVDVKNDSTIEFDMHKVDIGEYPDIVDVRIYMDIEADKNEIYMDTLRSSTTIQREEKNNQETTRIYFSKIDERLWRVEEEQLS